MHIKYLFYMLCATSFIPFSCTTDVKQKENELIHPQPVAFNDISIKGRLKKRALANFKRLERGRYLPDSIYIVPNPGYHKTRWPGDLPGRLVLGQTLLQQATHRQPKYLGQILDEFPENMNEKGYFGKIYKGKINEQQLSGHGWVLRGLCENYQYTGDKKVLKMIRTMVDSLVLPTKGMHQHYPIDPQKREKENAGNFMGTHQKVMGNWILSSDIGCDFIFMDGVIHAYEVLQTEKLKQITEEMINRFLQVDLDGIRAQTHATLTALRAILRYYEMTGKKEYLDAVEKRYNLYKRVAMTENHENYNWFGRPRWTEPCAVIDSYITAINLWRFTGKSQYLEDAQLIYYNGMGSEQRYNGGFGCNTCTGTHDPVSKQFTDPFFKIAVTESHWCCTMRGGEGLSRAVEYSYFTSGNQIILPDYHSSTATIKMDNGIIKLNQETNYPFSGGIKLHIIKNNLKTAPEIKCIAPEWTSGHKVSINGKKIPANIKEGFLCINKNLKTGDLIEIDFNMAKTAKPTRNPNSIEGYHSYWYGPLMLGVETEKELQLPMDATIIKKNDSLFAIQNHNINLKPLNHLMSPEVTKERGYMMQVLFK